MILAPMQGLTELLFRRTYEECFPGAIALAISPFISLTHGNLAEAWDKIDDVLPERNVGSIPVIPQILGKEPEEFIELANRLHEVGYDEVNWNMGCPMRKVTGKHRGSGILPYPDEVRQILDAIMPHLHTRLSVKVRLGLKDKEEIFRLVPILNDYPLASVTVHPRLGRQQYGGVPDMESFARLLPMLKAPVIYNGDILTTADARRINERYPKVADIMVGRGVLYSPTLPLEIGGAVLSDEERLHHAHLFVRRLIEAIDHELPTEQSRIRKKKEYWCLLWKSLQITETQARQVLHAQELTAVDKIIDHLIQ